MASDLDIEALVVVYAGLRFFFVGQLERSSSNRRGALPTGTGFRASSRDALA